MKKLFIIVLNLFSFQLVGQISDSPSSAVGFLSIAPDARGAALGETGVATKPDVNNQYWNAAKYMFANQQSELGISYLPWSTQLNDGAFNSYVSGYFKIDSLQAISGSFRWYSYGDEIRLSNETNQELGRYTPHEWAFDLAYSRKLAKNWSAALTLRYINSSISKPLTGTGYKTGHAIATDLSAFYRQNGVDVLGEVFDFSSGLNLSNIGSKITYLENGSASFLPMNMRLGGAAAYQISSIHSLALSLDFNKLLTPSAPERHADGSISKGKDPNKSVPSAIFGSFTDAPGGFSQEIKEVGAALGLEYRYMQLAALRTGYSTQSKLNGGISFYSFGGGLKYKVVTFDLAYIIPRTNLFAHSNALRFSVSVNLK